MKRFILMIQFFSRIPINLELQVEEEDFSKGVVFVPLVGGIIGLICLIAYEVLIRLFNSYIAIAFVTLINIMITGALHIDGLADTCDGIFSARKKDRMLEIMKDSRIGTNGAIAILFDVIFRILLLSSVQIQYLPQILIITPIVSRTILVVVMYTSSYAREGSGLGKLFIGSVTLKNTIIALFVGSLFVFITFGLKAFWLIVINLIIMLLLKRYISSKIGGMTGDTLGAINELSEIFVMLIFCVMERLLLI